jgi:hypothetical protein
MALVLENGIWKLQAAAAVDPLSPAAAWDSGDLGLLASTTYSDGTYTVGGATMTVANSANCTSIGPDGTNGIKITTPSTGVMYSSDNTSVQIYWDISALVGETPDAGWVYVAQFIISSASDEPSTTDDGMIMGFIEDPTSSEKAAVYHHLSNIKRTFGGATRLQNLGPTANNPLGADLITCNMMFKKDWQYGVQLSSSEQATPFFSAPGPTLTIQDTYPSTIDTAGTFRIVWGSYVYPSSGTTDSYILKRVRLWAFGK